ncbi:MAG: hypothetical protein HY709_04210 [Candidatus Latescibacteria bacterium]|nr:hypothetical protein [Candidatus Latescibacterota bacterium]
MRTQTRVKGLQNILADQRNGQQSQLELLNRLALLQREKERITQERENWQKKVEIIDARLEKITEMIKQFRRSLIAEDSAFNHHIHYQKSIDGRTVNKEVAANSMTIHY